MVKMELKGIQVIKDLKGIEVRKVRKGIKATKETVERKVNVEKKEIRVTKGIRENEEKEAPEDLEALMRVKDRIVAKKDKFLPKHLRERGS